MGIPRESNESGIRRYFFWIALTNANDSDHERATAFARSTTLGTICTTEEVLTEYLNYFAGWGWKLRQKAALNVQSIVDNSSVRVIPQTTESFLAGYELYRTRPDKGYSLTDCISMATMRRERIVDALTNDAHFEQEGLRAIFRTPR
jgi:predicted nucleic acid-binding protein